MKFVQRFKSVYTLTTQRLLAAMIMAASTPTFSITKTDLTQDTSGGKTLNDVADNLNNAAQSGATLIISIVAIGGWVVVALSLYSLWRASKDEREKPTSAVLGLFIGGAMAAVTTIMWIMKNTVTGTN